MLLELVVGITAITFASGDTYLSAKDAAEALGWSYQYDPITEIAQVKGQTLDPASRRLWNGEYLISRAQLMQLGATADHGALTTQGHRLRINRASKRVVVNLAAQELHAFEGTREVIRCQVSSGSPDKRTPTGRFRLGAKLREHVSDIYHTPMPWSVHVTGGIYIHGSEWFSGTPASHGCIRLDMHGETNWANWFYDWAQPGVPINIIAK